MIIVKKWIQDSDKHGILTYYRGKTWNPNISMILVKNGFSKTWNPNI